MCIVFLVIVMLVVLVYCRHPMCTALVESVCWWWICVVAGFGCGLSLLLLCCVYLCVRMQCVCHFVCVIVGVVYLLGLLCVVVVPCTYISWLVCV